MVPAIHDPRGVSGVRRATSPYKILIRHPRRGRDFELQDPPENTEDLVDAYLVPIEMKANTTSATLELVERTPSRTTMSIWDSSVPALLEALLKVDGLSKVDVDRLQPIVKSRKGIADIDRRIVNLKKQQRELDSRADQTRQNLAAIKKDPAAGGLRARLNRKLEKFTKEADSLGRTIVELTSKRLEKKIELEEALEKFTFEAPPTKVTK